jgi:DNA repair photolyase
MEEGFTKLNRNQFRYFEEWLSKHFEELYENKIAYEVRWKDEGFYVKLCDESSYTMDDIMLDIQQEVGYNSPN